MSFIDSITETLRSGDPYVRTWFMVHNEYLPFICSFVYVLFVKKVGPSLMKDRKPFDLRNLMIVYNFCIVAAYVTAISALVSLLFFDDGAVKDICEPTIILTHGYTYWAATAAWVLYVLKYVEFADTIFFVLRKKYHLITNLHVIHHAALPVIAWIFIRTERSGLQFFPGGLNAFIHIIMYTYYGLAAMGPEVQKYLWWKEYLTKLQMAQFVIIILFVTVVVPLVGCKTTQHGIYIDIFFALIFFALFYNFYIKTYKKPQQMKGTKQEFKTRVVTNGKCNGHEITNGVSSTYQINGELRSR